MAQARRSRPSWMPAQGDWPRLDELGHSIQGRFTPAYWGPILYQNQPATMGLLCNPAHPALKEFPSDFHSNW